MTDLTASVTGSASQMSDPVLLRVPAEPTMSRVARLASSGLASLAGFSVDEIEDIKIAVSEVLIALVEHGNGGSIDLEFGHSADDFVIIGRTGFDDFDLSHPDLRLCRTVLAGVCREHVIDAHDGVARITARVGVVR